MEGQAKRGIKDGGTGGGEGYVWSSGSFNRIPEDFPHQTAGQMIVASLRDILHLKIDNIAHPDPLRNSDSGSGESKTFYVIFQRPSI